MKIFVLLAIILFFCFWSVSYAQTPTPVPPTVVLIQPFGGSPVCEGDFAVCYGDMFVRALLACMAIFITFLCSARQRVLLSLMFLYFVLSFLPADVFAFWYMFFTFLLVVVDSVTAMGS